MPGLNLHNDGVSIGPVSFRFSNALSKLKTVGKLALGAITYFMPTVQAADEVMPDEFHLAQTNGTNPEKIDFGSSRLVCAKLGLSNYMVYATEELKKVTNILLSDACAEAQSPDKNNDFYGTKIAWADVKNYNEAALYRAYGNVEQSQIEECLKYLFDQSVECIKDMTEKDSTITGLSIGLGISGAALLIGSGFMVYNGYKNRQSANHASFFAGSKSTVHSDDVEAQQSCTKALKYGT